MMLSNLLHFDMPAAIKVIRSVENWPTYSLDFLGLLGSGYAIFRFRNGIRLKLRAGSCDRFTINEVFIRNIYFREGNPIGENDVVVDIGAHIGMFTVLASKAAKNGRVYAFEPCEENFALLRENVELNGLLNVTAFKAAVSSKGGRLRFFINERFNDCHSIYPIYKKTEETHVDSISLQEFVESNRIERIDFLKMDCEGAEYDILLNCPRRILKMVRKITLEYHSIPGHSAHELRELLEKSGFAVRIRDLGGQTESGLLFAKRTE